MIDSIKSILLLEQQEVMSVEGIEVNLFNEEIYGVSYEAETNYSDVIKKKPWVFNPKVVHKHTRSHY